MVFVSVKVFIFRVDNDIGYVVWRFVVVVEEDRSVIFCVYSRS